MKSLLITLSFFASLYLIGQEKAEILNYKVDYYYDSVNYELKWIYYSEIKNEKFYKSRYPINVIDSLEWINDSTFIERYRKDSFHYEPYSYLKIRDTLFINFKYYPSDKDTALTWTKEQKEVYYTNCYLNSESEEYCRCLTNFLSGNINYYELQTARRRSFLLRQAHLECK